MSKLAALVLNYVQTIESTKDLEYQDHVRELNLSHLIDCDGFLDEIRKAKAERDELKLRNEELKDTKEQVSKKLDSLRSDSETEKKRLASSDAENLKLTCEIDRLKSDNEGSQAKLQLLTTELETIKRTHGSMSSKVDNEKRVLQAQISEFNSKQEADKSTILRLEREKADLREAEKKLKAEMVEMKGKLQRQSEQTDRAVREQDKLRQQFSVEKNVFESKLDALRTKVKTTTSSNSPLKQPSSRSFMSPVSRRVPPTSVMTVGRLARPNTTNFSLELSPIKSRQSSTISPSRFSVKNQISSSQSPIRQNSSLSRKTAVSAVKKSTFSTTPFLTRTGKKLFGDPSNSASVGNQTSPTPGAAVIDKCVDNKDDGENEVELSRIPLSMTVQQPLFDKDQPDDSQLKQDNVESQTNENSNKTKSGKLSTDISIGDEDKENQLPTQDNVNNKQIDTNLENLESQTGIMNEPNFVGTPEIGRRISKPRLSIRSETSFTATTHNNKKISLFDDEETTTISAPAKLRKGKRKLRATVDSASLFDDEDNPDQPGSMFKRVNSVAPTSFTDLEKPISPRKKKNQGLRTVFKV